MAIKGSNTGERYWGQSSHADCRICPGLYPSSLSMISRKRNRNSILLRRSNTHTHTQTQTSAPFFWKHRNLYISVAFCLNVDIQWCQTVIRSTTLELRVYTVEQCGISSGSTLSKGLQNHGKTQSAGIFTANVCTKTCKRTYVLECPSVC